MVHAVIYCEQSFLRKCGADSNGVGEEEPKFSTAIDGGLLNGIETQLSLALEHRAYAR